MSGYARIRPLLFALDPERAHRLALAAVVTGLIAERPRPADPRLQRRLLGLDFRNPLGLAAGFDKNGEATNPLLSLGFGFVEVGTVTPLPQAGNPRPRLFRLDRDEAIINRLGFNNDGAEAVHRRLAARRRRGIVGVNVGANRDSGDRVTDYVAGVARFADVADYLVINVSSPNTPGLRDLQERAALVTLLAAVTTARDRAGKRTPLLLKIAPDLDDNALATIAETALSANIDGMIVANTTTGRDGVTDAKLAAEPGGLSGRPLFRRSTAMLAKLRRLTRGRLVLVGTGGIDSPATAFAKIAAGADLLELYTALVFEGPAVPRAILAGLGQILDERGFSSIAEAVGCEAEKLAAGEAGHPAIVTAAPRQGS
jgi:dihydroorotate dehydrogenase